MQKPITATLANKNTDQREEDKCFRTKMIKYGPKKEVTEEHKQIPCKMPNFTICTVHLIMLRRIN
jgi:hypothetical protein